MITRLTIAGMNSVHGVRAIYTALAGVPGISRADVRLGDAEIDHDGRATCEALTAAIALAGYAVETCVEERRRLV